METLHPLAIDLGLDRIKTVAEKLCLLNPQTKIITVAGTNGKGTFVASLESILLSQGKKVAAYTSPHLLNYNERIRINGGEANDEEICAAFDLIDKARDEISLTYFEFGTLAAFVLFAKQTLDYWILEVGLGGRLDAVNILDPHIAIITSIALDHEQWLGSDREKIAIEKAGILREGSVLVLAEVDEPQSLTKIIQQKNIHCKRIAKEFSFFDQNSYFHFKSSSGLQRSMASEYLPELPRPSLASAMEVASLENALPDSASLEKVLTNLALPGRMQKLGYKGREVLLDVAHNPAAGIYLANRLKKRGEQNVVAIVAVMADKNIPAILETLLPCVTHWCCCDLPGNTRAARAESLKQDLINLQVKPEAISLHTAPNDALEASTQYNSSCTLVFGSFFTVESVLRAIEGNKRG